jgi:hypothetical protein
VRYFEELGVKKENFLSQRQNEKDVLFLSKALLREDILIKD